jgi:hypothetical protein
MRRCLALSLLIGLMLLLTGTYATSEDAKTLEKNISNWSKPKDYDLKTLAFWVWYEEGSWYIRSTGGSKVMHNFKGRIDVVGGKLIGLDGKKGEKKGAGDKAIFSQKGIVFDFNTTDGADGVNFKVDDATTELKFTITVDGETAAKHIRIGNASTHPAEATFSVPAHPKDSTPAEKEKGKAKAKKKKD